MRLVTLWRHRSLIVCQWGREVLELLVGRDGVHVVFEPMEAGGAVGPDTWDQRGEIGGVWEGEVGEV